MAGLRAALEVVKAAGVLLVLVVVPLGAVAVTLAVALPVLALVLSLLGVTPFPKT